jgi:predicted small lipoprotein YifL
MKNQIKSLTALIMVLVLSACEIPKAVTDAAPVDSSNPTVKTDPVQQPKVETPVDPEAPVPVKVSLTYFSLSKTVAPVNGWVTKTYTATGSCVIYLTQTYCFDDGIKTLTWVSNNFTYGPYTYTYWQNGNNQPCNGGCLVDTFATPVVGGLVQTEVNKVFNLGVSHAVECDETDSKLDCGDFVITK